MRLIALTEMAVLGGITVVVFMASGPSGMGVPLGFVLAGWLLLGWTCGHAVSRWLE